jgi:hypothetical protein
MTLRERMGREASPSAAVLDSQSVKFGGKGQYATTKWVTRPESSRRGAKSTLWSTPTGCRCGSSFYSAAIQAATRWAGPRPIRNRVPRVELIWADGGYDAW